MSLSLEGSGVSINNDAVMNGLTQIDDLRSDSVSAVKVTSNSTITLASLATGTMFSFTTPSVSNVSSLRIILYVNTCILPNWYNTLGTTVYTLVDDSSTTYASANLVKYNGIGEMGGVMPHQIVLTGSVPCNTTLSLKVQLSNRMTLDAKCFTSAVAVYSGAS